MVGSLMHPSVSMRPDLAACVRELSSHLVHPAEAHIRAAERAIQHLHHTRHLRLTYKGSDERFYGTCDASHNSTHDCRGITGWAFHYAGGAIAWKCRAQTLVSFPQVHVRLQAATKAMTSSSARHRCLPHRSGHFVCHGSCTRRVTPMFTRHHPRSTPGPRCRLLPTALVGC